MELDELERADGSWWWDPAGGGPEALAIILLADLWLAVWALVAAGPPRRFELASALRLGWPSADPCGLLAAVAALERAGDGGQPGR